MNRVYRMPIASDVCAEFKDTDGEALANLFFGRVQNRDLATAEEIAGVFVEVLKLRRDNGQDTHVTLAQWESRLGLLRLLLTDQDEKANGSEVSEECSRFADFAFGADNRQIKISAPKHFCREQL